MKQTKQKVDYRAAIGTAIFHGLLLLWFIFFGLTTPLPLPEEEGVLVTLGYQNQGMGTSQPFTASPPARTQPSQPASDPESVATQNTEETVSLPPARQQVQQTQPRPESQPRSTVQPSPEPQPIAQQTTPEPPQPQVDPRALFPGSDSRNTNQQSQGETNQAGNQGDPGGSVVSDHFSGAGQGVGVEWSLGLGRPNQLPKPDYTVLEQGRVVVEIVVNRNGVVTRARAGARGSTTTNQTLYRLAEEAALKARFEIPANAPEEQRGTITYNFLRQN
jgi:TonB family protein